MLLGVVKAVQVGKIRPYTRENTFSAIEKGRVNTKCFVSKLGLTGDEQGDLKVHGGSDKAVHQYASEHYAVWRSELGPLEVLNGSSAFGENLHTAGMTEKDVCLCDKISIGSCLLEVSQFRQPCWKLNDRFGEPDMSLKAQQTKRTGWYYRVLSEGYVSEGDEINLLERPYPEWNLYRMAEIIYSGCLEPDVLKALSELPLTPSWVKMINFRLQERKVEDWNRRLYGNL